MCMESAGWNWLNSLPLNSSVLVSPGLPSRALGLCRTCATNASNRYADVFVLPGARGASWCVVTRTLSQDPLPVRRAGSAD